MENLSERQSNALTMSLDPDNFLCGGYDLVVECSESLLNRFLNTYFIMGYFPDIKGNYVLPLPNSPQDMLDFITIRYAVHFGIPEVDFIDNAGRIIFRPILSFVVLGGISFTVDAMISIEIRPQYDSINKRVVLDLRNPGISVRLNNAPVSRAVNDKLNQMMEIVVREYLTNKVPPIDISPFVKFNVKVPGTTGVFSINVMDFLLRENAMGAAVDFLNYTAGHAPFVKDFTRGNDFVLGLSQAGLQRFYEFWWKNSTIKKEVQGSGEIGHLNLKDFDLTLDGLRIALAAAIPNRFTFLGALMGLAVDLKRLAAVYTFNITLDKPHFSFSTGNRVRFSVKARANFRIELVLVYKIFDPKKLKKKEKSKRIATWTDSAKISVTGGARLYMDARNRMMAEIGDCDIFVDIGKLHLLFDAIISNLADKFLDKIVRKLSPVQLFALPIDTKIPNTKIQFPLSASLETTNKEAFFNVKAGRISGLEKYAAPPFIANTNPQCLEVHTAGCIDIDKMLPEHKKGYYFLQEAHEDGFDNCAHCIGDSKR